RSAEDSYLRRAYISVAKVYILLRASITRSSEAVFYFVRVFSKVLIFLLLASYKRNVSDEDKQLEVKKEVVVDVKQYSGVELIIKSGFGSTLPSKDDLIRTYEKI
ncbi:unnamed protein product, partial [Brassica oleracea var. botrytis]